MQTKQLPRKADQNSEITQTKEVQDDINQNQNKTILNLEKGNTKKNLYKGKYKLEMREKNKFKIIRTLLLLHQY